MARGIMRGLRAAVKNVAQQQQSQPICNAFRNSTRNFVSGLEKSAFEGKILRLIRNEIHYALQYCPPSPNALHERMRPWISKKITDFLGEEEVTLVD